MTFYEEGRRAGTFEDGIELALRRLLASPQFLVRAEKEAANVPVGRAYRISDLELASRLSFFLWSSIPDDELITVASQGRLSNPRILEQQVRRMLADSRSDALVGNFAAQLLYLRNLPATSPDGVFYPDWDDELRQGFRRETELFFDSIKREDRSVVDLLTADHVRQRAARQTLRHPQYLRVPFSTRDARGRTWITVEPAGEGSFLSITWTQNFRTSPVKRVYGSSRTSSALLREPPPNVPPLEDSASEA